ncbi:MAG: hypothetical protein AB1499_17835 [Nitrospirota bacterium]
MKGKRRDERNNENEEGVGKVKDAIPEAWKTAGTNDMTDNMTLVNMPDVL